MSVNIRILFGGRIRQLREARAITRDQLAVHLHVDRAVIGKYERGDVFPSADRLEQLASGLNAEIRDLFDFDPARREGGPPEAQIVTRAIEKLSKQDRRLVRAFLVAVGAFADEMTKRPHR